MQAVAPWLVVAAVALAGGCRTVIYDPDADVDDDAPADDEPRAAQVRPGTCDDWRVWAPLGGGADPIYGFEIACAATCVEDDAQRATLFCSGIDGHVAHCYCVVGELTPDDGQGEACLEPQRTVEFGLRGTCGGTFFGAPDDVAATCLDRARTSPCRGR